MNPGLDRLRRLTTNHSCGRSKDCGGLNRFNRTHLLIMLLLFYSTWLGYCVRQSCFSFKPYNEEWPNFVQLGSFWLDQQYLQVTCSMSNFLLCVKLTTLDGLNEIIWPSTDRFRSIPFIGVSKVFYISICMLHTECTLCGNFGDSCLESHLWYHQEHIYRLRIQYWFCLIFGHFDAS